MTRLSALAFILANLCFGLFGQQPSAAELEVFQKAAQIDVETATIDGVIRALGEPQEYLWGNRKFTKDQLPARYIAAYPGQFHLVVADGSVVELRFYKAGYRFMKTIQVGSTLDEVLKVLGAPASTVEGQPNRFVDGVLYKDIDGARGHHYFSSSNHGVRMFFGDDRVLALYLTRRSLLRQDTSRAPGQTAPAPPLSVEKYADVRRIPGRLRPVDGVANLDLSGASAILPTLTFNQDTTWPERSRMPAGVRPENLLKDAMNPGLGVRALHTRGITGKGVAVAIIDQPLYLDHPEYAGKIVTYHDTGCDSETSMHGPAVASLLVGTQTGVAPDALLYFAAAPSWTGDASYYAKALQWILEQNRKLPAGRKIRVVSVSAAPSGDGSPFKKDSQMWDDAVARAEQEGVLVLDCTPHHGFIGACWFGGEDRENPAHWMPGFPGIRMRRPSPKSVLAPASPRTVAEEYQKGHFGYQYTGRGGLSWAIPYAAGVLALGWQQRPELSGRQMVELLFQSAYSRDADTKIIQPAAFIRAVQAYSGK